jgi:4-amino-4-deoxy-L-arabinose transferase-like glycosyltransferase
VHGVFFRALSRRIKAFERISPRVWVALTAVVLLVIYVWSITQCGPWDPWETHYGEVARNIVVRGDPMDLWWRPGSGPDGKKEASFASKHALPFWCMALSFKAFGVGSGAADEMVRSPIIEISLRLPALIAGAATVGFLGWVVARITNWRAGLLTAIVLATMPQFAIVTRQAITDIFFIGPVCLAMGAWMLAWFQPDRTLRRRLSGWRSIPVDRLYFVYLGIFLCAIVVPLAVLHLHVVDSTTVAHVAKWEHRRRAPKVTDLETIALHLWIYWVLVAAVLIRSLKWTRRSQVWMGVVYIAGGLALMGKGMIGPGIIGALILADMLVSGRWRLLTRCGLPVGVLLFVLACFPWHHSMAIYRGERWVNELLITNNIARFASGEQEQAIGDYTFYLRALGLAAFPWVAVVPVAIWEAVQIRRERISEALAGREAEVQEPGKAAEPGEGADDQQTRSGLISLRIFALLWFVVSLGLITYSVTKYYHYLAPCLPPLAILVGTWLAGRLESKRSSHSRGLGLQGALVGFALACAILVLVVRSAIHEPAWLAHLTTYLYTGMWHKGAPEVERLGWCALPFVLGLLLWLARRGRAAVMALVLSGLITATYVIDDYLPAASESWSQRSAMRYYFDHRKGGDRILSWWFYYRGETFFTKQRVWVQMEPDKEKLHAYIDENRGKGRTFWVITTVGHAKRAGRHFPADVRHDIEIVYENFHYAMLEIPIP